MKRISILMALAGCSGSHAPATGDDSPAIDASATGGDAAISLACSGLAAQPLDKTWTVHAGNQDRQAEVHVPASYDPSRATPVVIDIHGLTSSGPDQARIAHMLAKSDAEGFIAVHPEGTEEVPSSFNAGYCCNPANSNYIDDVGFIRALVDQLAATLCVDPDRVFATGLSNGGYLSYRLACELSDRIAAVAPVAAVLGMGAGDFTKCTQARPVPVFAVNGTSDPLVFYNGGNGQRSVADSITFFATANGCTTTTTTYTNGDATCVAHGGCTGGADVVLCTITDGGHQWPGGESIGSVFGKKSDSLITTDAEWTFFVAHPRPVLGH